jgi:hypothetical protein
MTFNPATITAPAGTYQRGIQFADEEYRAATIQTNGMAGWSARAAHVAATTIGLLDSAAMIDELGQPDAARGILAAVADRYVTSLARLGWDGLRAALEATVA